MVAVGIRSATNSTTNLTTSPCPSPKAPVFEGFEYSLNGLKIILVFLLFVDVLFLGLFIPTAREFFSIQSFCLAGYFCCLLLALGGTIFNKPQLLLPARFIWLTTFLVTVLILLYSCWEYTICYGSFNLDVKNGCPHTFIASYIDTAIYVMILSLKLCQLCMAHIVAFLLWKIIRIQTFDARKHTIESDDEDVMVVFERAAGSSSPGKVRDAAIA